jgi:Ca-activated chloride channel family protein
MDQSLVVALDLSRSMNAQDINPDRITRARLKVLDILKRRQSAQVALIVYSANAFTVTPLTTDSKTIASLVGSLDTKIMPSRGSYPAAAIDKGMQLLKQAGVINGEVLLVTDGGSTSAAMASARKLKEEGYSLSILGVGSLNGAPIPQEDGGFITDRNGQIAVAKLDMEDLMELSRIGGGKYVSLTADDRDLDSLLSNRITSSSQGDQSLATDQWNEFGPWLLLIIMPIASLAFRRGWIF